MTEPVESEGTLSETLESAARFIGIRRWYILCPTFAVALAGCGLALYLPSRYTSEATVVVVQQRISQRYVDPASTGTTMDALNSITREIFSRDRLIAIINEFNLYNDDSKRVAPELLVQRVRKDSDIQPLDVDPRRDLSAFQISFTASSPRLARDVTARLTSLFIESNLKARGGQAATTTRFLEDRLAEAKQKLEQQEQRIRDFKVSNAGGMPDQEQYNLNTMTDLRIQLQSTTANLSRAQLQRMGLETELNANLSRLNSERTGLLAHYTAKHPDVVKKNEGTAKIQALLSRLRTGTHADDTTQAQIGNPVAVPGLSGAGAEDPAVVRLQGQIEAHLADTTGLAKEQTRLRTEIAQAQGRLRLTPVKEQQMAVVLREYDLYKQNYTDLLNKQLRAQMTASVEDQQEGQHFRLADPPTLPLAPSGPKRLLISLGGVGAGLALGFGLAILVAVRDRSFHFEKELRHQFSVPIVVGVPLLRTPVEKRKLAQRKVLEWTAASVMLLCIVVAELYVLRVN